MSSIVMFTCIGRRVVPSCMKRLFALCLRSLNNFLILPSYVFSNIRRCFSLQILQLDCNPSGWLVSELNFLTGNVIVQYEQYFVPSFLSYLIPFLCF